MLHLLHYFSATSFCFLVPLVLGRYFLIVSLLTPELPRPGHLQCPARVHPERVPHCAGPVQPGQAALRLDQLQGGLHTRGLHLLAARGEHSDKEMMMIIQLLGGVQYLQ